MCDNEYDALGRIVTDRRNGTDKLKTTYRYNIRNWITSIESPLFKEELHYTDGTGTPCYNGNISSISWKAGEEQTIRGYRFTYDGLDRMKKAEYGEGERFAINPNRFNEEVTAYDKTGNILGIRRMGQTGAQEYGLVDNLALTYSGNQLTKVTDNAASSAYNNGFEFKDGADRETEYTYDEDGNLTQDLNRNIEDIQYNFLNLPQRIEFGDGSTTEYLYDAEGRKLRTVHRADGKTTTTDYAGNLIYENGNPIRLVTEYGYVSLPDGMYHYYLQDHQGNNRVVADRNGKLEEVNHYYPFGGMFANNGNIQPYKYNGKELDTRKGLNWYDYGARHYDPAVGRWHVQDPMAEYYYVLTPYNYCNNNPICHRDEEGKFISNVIGAVVGGIADLGVQIAANIAVGNNPMEIDWISVGASTLEGGITSGLSMGKTLVVKAGVAVAKNTVKSQIEGGNVSDIASNTLKDVTTDVVFGKAGDLAGKELKAMFPKVNNFVSTKASKTRLSNTKGTRIAKEVFGVKDTKAARKMATKKDGIVDVSNILGGFIQNLPENGSTLGIKLSNKMYENYEQKKEKDRMSR